MANEPLGIVEERRAVAAKYARFIAPRRWQPAKEHRITVNCAKPEERKVERLERIAGPKRETVLLAVRVPDTSWRSKYTTNVLNAVAEAFHIPTHVLTGRTRSHKIAHARFAAVMLLRERRGLAYRPIYKIFGWHDHTTAMDAYKRAGELLAGSPEWAAMYHAALALLEPQR